MLKTLASLKGFSAGFFGFDNYFLPISCPPHDYYQVAFFLGLIPLAERRHFFGNIFLKGFVSGDADSPTLFSLINFKVPDVFLVLLQSSTFL